MMRVLNICLIGALVLAAADVYTIKFESARQAQHARSILGMNEIAVLDAVLPQRDGFVSLSATGRTGREAESAALRAIAIAVDQALLQFIAAATSDSGEVTFSMPADKRAKGTF